jgi:predicted GNAT family acetyltransferase
VRAYYVEQDGRVVAWGRSIQRCKSAAYVAGLYTIEAYRRQGIASALMQRLLADDAAAGARYSVLLASGTGYPLYQRLGYVPLGWLYLFTLKPGNRLGNG